MQVASLSTLFSRFVSRFGRCNILQYPHQRLGHLRRRACMEAQDFVSKIQQLAKMDRAKIREDDQRGFKYNDTIQ
jgi:hypothetical protein